MRPRGTIAVALLAAALSSCSDSGGKEPEDTTPASSGELFVEVPEGDARVRVLVRRESADGGADALVSGVLEASGSCLGVTVEGVPYPVVFPPGTTSEGDAITLPSGDELRTGDQVSLGGGFHSSPLPAGLPEIPEDCLGSTQEIVVLNPDQ